MKLADDAAIRACAMEVRRAALRSGRFVYVYAEGPQRLFCSTEQHKDKELLGVYGEHSPVSFVEEDIVDYARRVGAYVRRGE